ncbi:MAG: hypothetical protein SVY15_09410 [Halobacteriota archaeon]|nr:hypothetical protein [Halobacteriota archaeon]
MMAIKGGRPQDSIMVRFERLEIFFMAVVNLAFNQDDLEGFGMGSSSKIF